MPKAEAVYLGGRIHLFPHPYGLELTQHDGKQVIDSIYLSRQVGKALYKELAKMYQEAE